MWDNLIGEEIDPTGGGTYTSSRWYAWDVGPQTRMNGQVGPAGMGGIALQFDGSGNLLVRYLDAPSTTAHTDAAFADLAEGDITTQGSAGTLYFMLTDNLGTLRDAVDTSGTVQDHLVYTAFGQVFSESNASIGHWQDFAFQHLDPNTRLALDGHRWYDATTGKWMTEDPAGFRGGDPNLDRYADNRVTQAVDPSGLQAHGYSPLAGNPLYELQEAIFSPIANFLGITQESVMAQAHARQQALQAAVIQAATQQYMAMLAAMQAQGPPNWVDTTLGVGSNFFGGFANIVTFGYSNQWVAAMGNGAFVNTNSGWYTAGQAAGWLWWGAMGTTVAWNAAGWPTYNVGIGPSQVAYKPFHMIFGTTNGTGATTWFHAVGYPGSMWVTIPSRGVVGSMWGTLTGVPIWSANAVGSATSATNCITACGWGFVQGWAAIL